MTISILSFPLVHQLSSSILQKSKQHNTGINEKIVIFKDNFLNIIINASKVILYYDGTIVNKIYNDWLKIDITKFLYNVKV